MADLLPPVPSKAAADRLFNDHTRTLRGAELIKVAHHYTNKELTDRENTIRQANAFVKRPKASNIITKFLTTDIKAAALAANVRPALYRCIFDTRRYQCLKRKLGIDPQTLRSLRSLILSGAHSYGLAPIPDKPKIEDIRPHLGKAWGRAPDNVWTALLPFVGEAGRDMDVCHWVMEVFGRKTEESAYGLVNDVRKYALPIKDILENYQDENEKLIQYANDEVQKIQDDQNAEARSVSFASPVMQTRIPPSRVTKSPRQTTASSMQPRRTTTAQKSPDVAALSSLSIADDETVMDGIEAAPSTSPTWTPTTAPTTAPSSEPTTTSVVAIRPLIPPQAPITPSQSLLDALFTRASQLPIKRDELVINLDDEDHATFADYINQKGQALTGVHGPMFFLSYMLASLVELVLRKSTERMRPFQHLHHAATIFAAEAHKKHPFLLYHATAVEQPRNGNTAAFYLLLYGLHIKYTIDPSGANDLWLTDVTWNYGNEVERECCKWFLNESNQQGTLPRYVDPLTNRDMKLAALSKWLREPYPLKGLMTYFYESIPDVLHLYVPTNNELWSLSPSSNPNLASATAKLASALRLLNNTRSSPDFTQISLASRLNTETENMDPSYLWIYFGFFLAEFKDHKIWERFCALSDNRLEWVETGHAMMSAIREWLDKYGENGDVLECVVKAISE